MSENSGSSNEQPSQPSQPQPSSLSKPDAQQSDRGPSGTSLTLVEQQIATYSGPIPHPAMLRAYENVLPGAAERIMRMAENQSSHRIDIETKVIEGNIRNERFGSIVGAYVISATLVAAVAMVLAGQTAAGVVSIFAALGSFLGSTIFASVRANRELQQKQKQLEERLESAERRLAQPRQSLPQPPKTSRSSRNKKRKK